MCKKNIKKGFFVNNKKYLLYLVFLGIFCTFCDHLIANSTTSQNSTTTQNTTPQKKHKSKKAATKKTAPSTKCPHADVPAELLTSAEIEEVLACTQNKKDSLDNQVEQLEELLQQTKTEENADPAATQEKIVQRKKYLLNYITDAPRCPYSTTPLKKLKAEQLEEVYVYTQTHKMDSAFMIDLLERLIALSDNHAGVKKYKLQLADTHYAVHHIEKAAACYEDFGVLYPGSEESEYVLYKAVVCMFEISLEPDRDQTNTKKTITLIKEFLKRAKKADLIQEANTILEQCYGRLYDHEVYVFNFYNKKKNFVAAQMRLDYIAKTFTDTIKNLDEKVAALAEQLELRKNPIKPTRTALVNKLLA
jgi:outer membrane assembly lipoprotein YfiO